MDTELRKFFVAQRQRVHRVLRTRCGRMGDIDDSVDRRIFTVTVRGQGGHASGRRKPSMDGQGPQAPFITGGTRRRRTAVTWKDYERKAGRMEAHTNGSRDDE